MNTVGQITGAIGFAARGGQRIGKLRGRAPALEGREEAPRTRPWGRLGEMSCGGAGTEHEAVEKNGSRVGLAFARMGDWGWRGGSSWGIV